MRWCVCKYATGRLCLAYSKFDKICDATSMSKYIYMYRPDSMLQRYSVQLRRSTHRVNGSVCRHIKENNNDYSAGLVYVQNWNLVIIVPADVRAPGSVRPSTGNVLLLNETCIHLSLCINDDRTTSFKMAYAISRNIAAFRVT